MASSSSQSGGVLFIYEEDGLYWVKYLMRLLRGPAYSIPCDSVLWHKLDQQLTSCNPVHVLFLTPEMEAHVSEIKFDLLNFASETSLLLDCNIVYPLPGMVEWASKHTLKHCEENQQALLATIIESYETAVNCVPDVEIAPTMIYPGQEQIYVFFSTNQQDSEIIVKIDGNVKLRTRRFSDHIFACDIPQITCGKKKIDVYKNNTTIPIYTTTVSVVTVRAILMNLIDDLDNIYGTSSKSENDTHKGFIRREMGINFNPFHKASDNELKGFTEQVNQLYTNSKQRDSGFVPDSDENEKFMSMDEMNASMPNLLDLDKIGDGHIRRSDESHNRYQRRPDELQGGHLRRSDELQGGHLRRSDELQAVHKGPQAPKTRIKKFLEFIGRGPSKSENEANAVKNPRRRKRSVRVTKAMNTRMVDVPLMPGKEVNLDSICYSD